MKVLAILIPFLFFASFLFALSRQVKVYDSFTEGMKSAVPLILSLFPYIAAVTMLNKLLEVSGLMDKISALLRPCFDRIGIPNEIAPLVFMKPLSGG